LRVRCRFALRFGWNLAGLLEGVDGGLFAPDRGFDLLGDGLERAQLLAHLFLVALGFPEVRLVAGVLGHQHRHGTLGLASGSSFALDGPDRRRHRFVKQYEVDLGDVQALLGHGRRDEYFELPGPERVEGLLLFGLGHPVAAVGVGLPDELARLEVLAQEVGQRLRGVPRLGEDDDALAAFDT
jgi:hypothetical protein